ncbi:MAG: esterase-like activity of phytase family protein [Ferruginibacter sp.]
MNSRILPTKSFKSKGPGKILFSIFQQKQFTLSVFALLLLLLNDNVSNGQITLVQDYQNNFSAPIGTYQGINFREAGFSALYPIPNTNGKEYWTVSDRGPNIDGANANPIACRPTYDKIFPFPGFAPKIHRIRINGDSIQILQTITMKRPSGATATGVLNPAGFGSTVAEIVSTDTVLDCANFNAKTAPKDVWGIDSEGILVDKDGNFWICEEGGPTIWKLNAVGVVLKRYTPYGNLPGIQPQDIAIDTSFKYRKNNRGFEGIAITPNGKIYAFIQSPILYPTAAVGNASRIHRILEIDPVTNVMRMLAYVNEGSIGVAGANQIRMQDWKIGDAAAVNDSTFLVLEAAARGTSDIKSIYLININQATAVTSGLYGGKTLEGLVDNTGLNANGILPVTKTLFMDLLANGWPSALDKAEGLAIINDSTIAICNDNDFGQASPNANGIATVTNKNSHLLLYSLKGINKLPNYSPPLLDAGTTSITSSQSPYLQPAAPGVSFTSIITANDVVGGYKMAGTPDGLGAFDNGNGTFTVLMNHEFVPTAGAVRAHGSMGAFVSKWIINKSNLSVVSGSDLIQSVRLWNPLTSSYTTGTTAFNRFCSGDLPAITAFYNSTTGMGTQERIYMNGEEAGAEGRAIGHIVTGPNAGISYELPYLGKFSWENSVASPTMSDKTVVAGMDDATVGGQVYFYIGTKTNTGTEINKAGLSNGKLFGVMVTGMIAETSLSVPAVGTRFSLYDLGSVQNSTGAALDAASVAAGVTSFLRPEDGAWDPVNKRDFYFATTNSFSSPSRLWRLRFDDPLNPESGGIIEAVLDGTEGQKMLDNITIDNYGHVLMVEDVGGNAHNGKVWQYTIATDALKQIGKHDQTRFGDIGIPATAPYNQDEEASGVIDVQEILGAGWFITSDQAHYNTGIPTDVVEGGQFLAMFNPDTYNSSLTVLPVQSVAFTARLANGKSYLQWTTQNEVNVKYFEVERGKDGGQFNKITVVNAKGTGSADYNTIDEKPLNGNNYYRLKIIDNDGNISYSNTLLIKLSLSGRFEFVMYPNPAKDVVVIAPSGTNAPVSITIFNQKGQRVLVKQINGTSNISVGHLAKGIYVVRLISNGVSRVGKLVRE